MRLVMPVRFDPHTKLHKDPLMQRSLRVKNADVMHFLWLFTACSLAFRRLSLLRRLVVITLSMSWRLRALICELRFT